MSDPKANNEVDPPNIDDDDNANDQTPLFVKTAGKGELSDVKNADDLLNYLGFQRFQWKLFILCGMGNFVEAIEMQLSAVLLPILKKDFNLGNYELAALGSFTYVGMLIGALVLGRYSDKVGRQFVFQLSLFISSFFGFVGAFAPNIYWFIASRFLLGIGYGGNIVTDVVLLAEMIPVHNRGRYLTAIEIFFGFGALLVVLIGWIVVPWLGWRWMIALSSLPAMVLLLFRRSIPESPRFLLQAGRHDEAVEVFQQIARYNNMPEETVEKIGKLQLEMPSESYDDMYASYSKLFDPVLRSLTIALVLTWFFNSFASSYFLWLPLYVSEGSVAAVEAGTSQNYVFLTGVLMGVGDFVGAVALVMGVESFDRRTIMRAGLIMSAVGVFALGFAEDRTTIIVGAPFLTAVRTLVIATLYAYTPELYPTDIRTTGLGLCSSFHRLAPTIGHWVVAVAYNFSFLYLSIIFASMFICAAIASLFLKYDTRNLPLAAYYHVAAAQHHHHD